MLSTWWLPRIKPRFNNYKSRNNLSMKMKIDEDIYLHRCVDNWVTEHVEVGDTARHGTPCFYIVTCRGVRVTKWRGLVRVIGFINTLVTTSFNYTQIQRYRWFTHTSQLNVTRTSPLLVMTSTQKLSLQITTIITHEIFQSHFTSSQADLLYSVRVLPS
jgi:hypothetical protein